MTNFQRQGSISNSHFGRDFEERARAVLAAHDIPLQFSHWVPCGFGNYEKLHSFDLGSEDPPVIVECKSQTWTKGDFVPSVKMKNSAEAMFYIQIAPSGYRNIFFVEKSLRVREGESLLSHFRRTRGHMIPPDVEFWELPRGSDDVKVYGSIADGRG
ncbi:hypothetical protein [Ruegeria arenilitoris]|uniref:hypothetical protein n=1 Tax=Ruegeria arenilitoris TaxID=1173585 RepID=UPI00147CF22B|nr:hypothetical protein [Ruegeria arenilitoris]